MNNNLLPYGSTLKSYVAHSEISNPDLRHFINKKGFLLSKYDRQNVLPILETILLTPEEFQAIRDITKGKTDKIKRLSKTFALQKDINLLEELIDFHFDSEENQMNQKYEFSICPEITENNGDCIFEYKIKSYDRHLSWGEQISEHSGAVIIKKHENKVAIEALAEYTSPETKHINEDIIAAIKKHFIKKEIFAQNVKPEFIKYDDFLNNEERVSFFLSFKNINISGLTFSDIEEIVFAPDPRIDIKDTDLAWMEDHIKRTIFTGKEIDKIIFFENDSNHKVVTIESLVLLYSYSKDGIDATVKIKISFPDIIKETIPEKPFEFTILNIKFSDDKKKSEKSIEKFISENFHIQKDVLFEKIKKSRIEN